MTFAEAISSTRERIIKDPTAEFPFLEEIHNSAEAREIATRNALTGMMLANSGAGGIISSYLAALAMGIQIGLTWGKAQAETASLEKMFDSEEKGE